MDNIPTRKTSEHFQGEIAQMRYFSEEVKEQTLPSKTYAHRDDYYIFLLIEEGKGKVLIDFEEQELTGKSIFCILPGQVHLPGTGVSGCGWFLAVDSMVVRDEYKGVFEKSVMAGNSVKTDEETINNLKNCASIIYKRLKAGSENTGQHILRDLLSSYIGMIAEVYQNELPATINKRSAVITYKFKNLLSTHYRSMKRPSQYAAKLNISAVYLYEAVKETTEQSASNYIRNEIVIQAKRLLFYTNMSVKEIALELGYEDWAYFTRLFTKTAKLSPTQFKKKYLE
ncbi:AraC family transcriptional activator of pobA [Dysgonomonas sp. PH5-45]|uniref:AraC family transcriptional regulator n=1 Tax=unclassified Dysgonomonas TaxID=2630389 RepID=UPI00247680ED|nr:MULTISPECIES: AraC family transcriptional regulator [unclassified Dysgonomonas]MDH6354292.1 AraC family transcriptional activator of pobA [Dysgonomonas sp. PH5-45]MDH6387193.1 AraC family transcriptional activator of pobA [Dysgonomonas sp. PH5-37]